MRKNKLFSKRLTIYLTEKEASVIDYIQRDNEVLKSAVIREKIKLTNYDDPTLPEKILKLSKEKNEPLIKKENTYLTDKDWEKLVDIQKKTLVARGVIARCILHLNGLFD